jgi:hypothetical protein
LNELNVNYSKQLWQICSQESIPLIYASSAATYGNGDNGFSDDPSQIKQLKPMNPYGESKQFFDLWMMEQAYDIASLRSEMLGFSWHVDHIYPLQGKTVSGLHTPLNLQVIPWSANIRKANRLVERTQPWLT